MDPATPGEKILTNLATLESLVHTQGFPAPPPNSRGISWITTNSPPSPQFLLKEGGSRTEIALRCTQRKSCCLCLQECFKNKKEAKTTWNNLKPKRQKDSSLLFSSQMKVWFIECWELHQLKSEQVQPKHLLGLPQVKFCIKIFDCYLSSQCLKSAKLGIKAQLSHSQRCDLRNVI